jgi:peptidoglycan hydrolase-like protein with peptidoglycan-binding domain
MHRLGILALVALLMPAVASAASCQPLSKGMSGSQVGALQQVLHDSYQDFPIPTGYFGPATEAALKHWQRDHDIASSGAASTTGWGVFGPKTAAAMHVDLCGGAVAASANAATGNPNQARIDSLYTALKILQERIQEILASRYGATTTAVATTSSTGTPTTSIGVATSITCVLRSIPACPNGSLKWLGNDGTGCSLGYQCIAGTGTSNSQ